jgi:hypothetical protein
MTQTICTLLSICLFVVVNQAHALEESGGGILLSGPRYGMTYIDLNMVRAGVVQHPCKWPMSGYRG